MGVSQSLKERSIRLKYACKREMTSFSYLITSKHQENRATIESKAKCILAYFNIAFATFMGS